MINKVNCYVLICVLCLFLSGCWDAVPIEERGFIIGIAIDLEDNEEKENGDYQVEITNQFVVPHGMSIIGNSSGGGGGGSQPYMNFSFTSTSIQDVKQQLTTVSSKLPFYEHLVLFAISEKAARKKHLFSDIMDTLIRDVDMRRSVKVVLSKQEAKRILEFTAIQQNLPSMLVNDLVEHGEKHAGFLTPPSVGDIEEFHLNENSYVLPIAMVDKIVEYKEAAVFNGGENKMIGTLNEEELNGLEFIVEDAKNKIVPIPFEKELLAFRIDNIKSNVTVNPKVIDAMEIVIDIKLDGGIVETFKQRDYFKQTALRDAESAVSKEIENLIQKTIDKGQKELQTDIFKIWQILESKHYKVWEQVKDNWDRGENYFSHATFKVQVDTEIHSTGSTNKSNDSRR